MNFLSITWDPSLGIDLGFFTIRWYSLMFVAAFILGLRLMKKIYVEEKYTRAAPGGVGFSKNAGNYGASMLATALAKKAGYDQVLWTDAFEHKYLQEVGTMNVFFIIGDTAVTPSLEEGTILSGVTRDSAITVLQEMGFKIEERKIRRAAKTPEQIEADDKKLDASAGITAGDAFAGDPSPMVSPTMKADTLNQVQGENAELSSGTNAIVAPTTINNITNNYGNGGEGGTAIYGVPTAQKGTKVKHSNIR